MPIKSEAVQQMTRLTTTTEVIMVERFTHIFILETDYTEVNYDFLLFSFKTTYTVIYIILPAKHKLMFLGLVTNIKKCYLFFLILFLPPWLLNA